MATSKKFEGPNYTQLPNVILDELLPKLKSANAIKILMLIARQTFGWANGKRLDRDVLSITSIMEKTGIEDRNAVCAELKSFLEQGIIARKKAGKSFRYWIPLKTTDYVHKPVRKRSQPDSTSMEFHTSNSMEFHTSKPRFPLSKSSAKETIKKDIVISNDITEGCGNVHNLSGSKHSPPPPKISAASQSEDNIDFNSIVLFDHEPLSSTAKAYLKKVALTNMPRIKRNYAYYLHHVDSGRPIKTSHEKFLQWAIAKDMGAKQEGYESNAKYAKAMIASYGLKNIKISKTSTNFISGKHVIESIPIDLPKHSFREAFHKLVGIKS